MLIVTPAARGSTKGNRITAERWARCLRLLDHRVEIAPLYERQSCDILVALHARKSAPSVMRFSTAHGGKPIVVALTGTDLYQDIGHSRIAQRSLQLAWRLIVLQPLGAKDLPPRFRRKVRVIIQSAEAPRRKPRPLKTAFEICIMGHLRPVKDPFRAAMAVRRLPASSRIQITHMGAALGRTMERRALAEMARNPRYRWLGEVSHGMALARLARSRLLVLTSRLEGAANVVSEALAAQVPILSSRIAGSVGVLGEDYPGFFPVGKTSMLAELLLRAENDRAFYATLESRCAQLRPRVEPAREVAAWQNLLDEL